MAKKLSFEDLKKLEIFPMYGVQQLTKIGGSYTIILPRPWVEFYAYEAINSAKEDTPETTYWVEISLEEDGIIRIRPLDVEVFLKTATSIREKIKEEK